TPRALRRRRSTRSLKRLGRRAMSPRLPDRRQKADRSVRAGHAQKQGHSSSEHDACKEEIHLAWYSRQRIEVGAAEEEVEAAGEGEEQENRHQFVANFPSLR